MKKYYQAAVTSLLLALCLTSCKENKEDYPTNYVGFEHSSQKYSYDKNRQEDVLEVKIIAVDKEEKDRVLRLSGSSFEVPGEPSCFQLTERQVTIKANQKSVTTRVKLFPSRIQRNTSLRLTCTPQWKENDPKQSVLIIQFTPK